MKKQKKLYPLKFVPYPSVHPWGEESWNIVSLESVSSEVSEGFLAENTLEDILETYMGDLVGDAIFDCYNLFFPLIVKTADIKGKSSLQVHPSDEIGFERYDQFGKTKLWYVMDASPDAVVYMGFNRKVGADEFYHKCKDGSVVELLNAIRPKAGDCFIIEPGTVHCAAGVKIAEVQQNSDLFFRLYDWGRENNPATAREMNLEEAIDIIDYEPYDGSGFIRRVKGSAVVANDEHFTVTSIDLDKSYSLDVSKFESCIIYLCTSGSFEVVTDEGYSCTAGCGDTILIPANLPDCELKALSDETHLLEISIPKPVDEEDEYLKK